MESIFLLAAVKSCALAGAGVLALRALPEQSLAFRRHLALGVLWALLLVPWIAAPALTVAAETLPGPTSPFLHSWLVPGLLALWAVGSTVRLVRLAWEVRTLRNHLHRSVPHSHTTLAPVRCSDSLESPCTWGIIHPVILMPATAVQWPYEAWHAALAHEEQHVRQHDSLHRLAAALIRATFWWNPLVHALCRRLELESELCCDQAATRDNNSVNSRRAYGELLLSLATGTRYETAAAWSSAGGLRERMHRLLSPASTRARRLSPGRMIVLTFALLLAIGCCFTPKFSPLLRAEAKLRLEANPFPSE